MIGKKDIVVLARSLIDQNPNTLRRPESYLQHIEMTYDIAEQIVKNVLGHYPVIGLHPREVAGAAGLHDIGRPMQGDQTFHELRGAQYIEDHGVEKGVAPSERQVSVIAQMVRPHAFVYEFWQDQACREKRKEFEPFDSVLLLPRTWQESIVAYADLSIGKGDKDGQRISVQERMRVLIDSYTRNPERADPAVARSVIKSEERIFRLAKRVEALEQGRLSDRQIDRYGFL